VRWLHWADRIDLLDRPGWETPYLTDSFAVGTQLRYPSSVAPWTDKVSRGGRGPAEAELRRKANG
jgi:hypothetical protein